MPEARNNHQAKRIELASNSAYLWNVLYPSGVSMFVRLAWVAALFALTGTGTASAADTIYSVSSDRMTAILTTMGMKVVNSTGPTSDTPWLVVTGKDGALFNVFLYQCDGKPTNPAAQCQQIQFRMLWNNTNNRTTDDINRFHLAKVFGRGYLTEDRKDIGLEYPMHLKYGVTERNLRENVEYFLQVVPDFIDIVKP